MFLYKSTYKRWNRLDNKQYIDSHLFPLAKTKGNDRRKARMVHYLKATSFVVLMICCKHPYLCIFRHFHMIIYYFTDESCFSANIGLRCLISCAGMFPWSMQLQPQGKWSKPPCFEPPTHRCVDGRSCVFVCQYNGIRTYRAYCVIPANAQDKYMCCCPP